MTQESKVVQYLYAPIVRTQQFPLDPATDDMASINSLPNPPLVPLTLDQVFIRQCRLAGDAVDAHFGCFRTEDLPKLLRMVQGAPALIGHNRTGIATARFFGGSITKHQNHNYIMPKFYWPRKLSYAEDLRVQIDTAIMNEASIAFTYGKPTCAICDKDIRDCDHSPGEYYNETLCFYFYDDLQSVLEGSFVYRGAEPGTGFLSKSPPPPSHIILDGRIFALTEQKGK